MKFATKLTILFSVIFLVIGATISYFVYIASSDFLEKYLSDRFRNQAFHTMKKIDMLLFERSADMKIMASDPVIRAGNSSPEQITRKLALYKDAYKYASVSFFDMNRKRIADTAGKDIGKQHPLAGYWKDLAQGKDFVIDISGSQSLGMPVFHIASVVRNNAGTPVGFLVSRVPNGRLEEIVEQITGIFVFGKDIRMDLLSKEGLILYSDYNEKGVLKQISPDWEDIKKSMRKGEKTGAGRHVHPEIGDEIHAYAIEDGYLDFKGNEWILVIHLPAKLVFAPAAVIRNRIILFMGMAGLLIILLIRYFSRRVTRPIGDLINTSAEIAKGNLDVHIKASSNDEIGALSLSFDRMAKSLQQAQEGLLTYANELEVKVAERTAALTSVNKELQVEINERRQTEEALLEIKAELEMRNYEESLLSEMTESLQVCATLEDAYDSITQTTVQLFQDSSGILLLCNDSGAIPEAVAAWGGYSGSLQENNEGCIAMRCGQIESYGAVQCSFAATPAGTHICMPLLEEKSRAFGAVHLLLNPDSAVQTDKGMEGMKLLAEDFANRLSVALSNLRLREKLLSLSIRDQLTGLFNRRYMEESFERELLRAERRGLPLAIVMLDIDYFKRLNDTLGHAAGDVLLRGLGKFLLQHIRGSDIACRYGGEEFMLILPEAPLDVALRRAEHLRQAVKFLQTEHEGKVLEQITFSAGVAVFPEHGLTMDSIMQAADAALYLAKKTGRDRVCAADKPMERSADLQVENK